VKRIAVKIAYRGITFHGWQRQPREISVQETIEESLFKLLGKREKYPIVGCGRTDTGVHASEYFFHVDVPKETDLQDLGHKLNRVVGSEIVIKEMKEVASDWHARFDAKKRTYHYFIHREKDPFITDESVYVPGPLDFGKMNEACQYLMGKQDFTSLSKLHTDVKTNICTVSEAKWVQMNETRFYFEISADRFLRNMVRATVGTLLEIGQGKMEPSEMKTILEKMDRGAASQSAPGQGLFLCGVEY
jgi:tRNA pseudouridine38-40 synthase|tara:strand:- start:36330 stop:37067 length:738 start_codon:yes stop_codon:yes gene_type:complete